jgi:hypothetical protein
MIKPQSFQIFTGVYNRSILVCVNETDEQVKLHLWNLGYVPDATEAKRVSELCAPKSVSEAYTYVFNDRDCLVRLRVEEINPIFHDCVAHELLHVTLAILDHARIKLGSKSEEAYAYLLGYLTREFYTKLEI